MTFLEAVSFFNEIKASQFPAILPFEISDCGIGKDSTAFRFEVYRMAKKSDQVLLESFNDGNTDYDIIMDVKNNSVRRIGFGSYEYTLDTAVSKNIIKVEQVLNYLEGSNLSVLCGEYVERVQATKL